MFAIICLAVATALSPVQGPSPATMEPCLSDDGSGPNPCYYDASERGNGKGFDFVKIDGKYYILPTR